VSVSVSVFEPSLSACTDASDDMDDVVDRVLGD
jgi:hypothetical protein